MAKQAVILKTSEPHPRILLGDRPPSYLGKARLATELDISESTVDDYVKRGLLPKPLRIGGSVRWNWAQVQAALDSGTGGNISEDPFMAGLKNVSQNS
jgi:predicted DNA-binding transcriptional regulator AlpA